MKHKVQNNTMIMTLTLNALQSPLSSFICKEKNYTNTRILLYNGNVSVWCNMLIQNSGEVQHLSHITCSEPWAFVLLFHYWPTCPCEIHMNDCELALICLDMLFPGRDLQVVETKVKPSQHAAKKHKHKNTNLDTVFLVTCRIFIKMCI